MFDTRDLSRFQQDFLQKITSPSMDAPAGLRVHHDTWLFGLIDVLHGRFGTTAQALGEAAFNAFARDYVLSHPLRSGDRSTYGDGFPVFLRGHAHAATLPWLADLAALDLALDHAHHAADAEGCRLDTLLAPDAMCALHPSVSVIHLQHDIKTLHGALMAGTPPSPPRPVTCDLLVGRNAEYDIIQLCLAPLEARFVALIRGHRSLFAAIAALEPDDNDLLILQTLLARLVHNSLLTST